MPRPLLDSTFSRTRDFMTPQSWGEIMKREIIVLAAAATLVAGCARRPDAITPVAIPVAAYQNLDCRQLAQETIRENEILAALSEQQNSAATGDAVGVFLLGVPLSSTFGGDKEGQVAVSKGKVNALEAAMQSKNCARS
jgi:type IV pilus biogenesis protein CpaD/CtpE